MFSRGKIGGKWRAQGGRFSGSGSCTNRSIRAALTKRRAKIARDCLKKGALQFTEGNLKTRKWADKCGQDRFTSVVEARELKLLGGDEVCDDVVTGSGEVEAN